MCILCHQRNPEINIQQLKNGILNPHFEEWNTTSLSHVLLSIRGLDGAEGHKLGKKLAEMFYEWYGGWSKGLWQHFTTYFPPHGCEEFPKYSEIRKMIDNAELYYLMNKHMTREQMIADIMH